MLKFIMLTIIILAAVLAEAHTLDVSFITVNGKPTVEIIKDDMIYQVEISKDDLENLQPSDIVKKICKQSKLCLSK